MITKILLADDHGILRQGIRTLIEKHTDMQVVGEADNGLIAVEMTRILRPDVVVMDMSMPLLNGIEAALQIKSELPSVKILALSVHAEKEFVLKAIRAGVSGYMLKECAFDDLVHAINTIVSGQSYLSPRIASIVLESMTKNPALCVVDVDGKPLTARETQILQLVTNGASAKQIARELGISVKTTEAIRRHIMEKTQIDSIAGLTKYAIRKGITTDQDN
jgi:two-component system response regulator NreC